MAIVDTGASGHYFLPHAPLANVNANAPRTTIRTATGQPLISTGTATLTLPNLPPITRHGHIVPGLTHNLLSIGKLCDARCTARFTAHTLTITDTAGTVILSGTRDTYGPRLWRVSLTPPHHPLALHIARPHTHFNPKATNHTPLSEIDTTTQGLAKDPPRNPTPTPPPPPNVQQFAPMIFPPLELWWHSYMPLQDTQSNQRGFRLSRKGTITLGRDSHTPLWPNIARVQMLPFRATWHNHVNTSDLPQAHTPLQ